MKRVVACVVLAVAVAGCGGGESVDCGPLIQIVEGASEEVSGAKGRWLAEKTFPDPDWDRVRDLEAAIVEREVELREIELEVRTAGCSEELDAFRLEFYGEDGPIQVP